MTPDDLDFYVKWISIADLIKVQEEDVVIYKNESTVSGIEARIDAKAEYTDYKGVFHSLPVVLEWDSNWISQGGVHRIAAYVLDTSTNEKIYRTVSPYLYVLNQPYISRPSAIYIFEGETINVGSLGATGYGELPNFRDKTIDRHVIDLTFHDEAVNIWDAGTYYASFSGGFTDYLSVKQTMSFPVTVVVQRRAGLTKEEKIEVNSSDFWVSVTEIYHNMKKG